MKLRKLLVIGLVVFALLATASLAGAECLHSGKVVLSYSDADGRNYVYLAENNFFPTYYQFFYTEDESMMNQLASAQAGNLKVFISGSATSCPAAGDIRFGGNINYLYISTGY